jgi:hypothetical protein
MLATNRKVRTVFMLGPSEREVLEKLASDTGAPVSELLRVGSGLARSA